MSVTTVLLIVASQGYQPIEYGHTRKVLEQAGFKVVVASDKKGTAYANPDGDHAKKCADERCGKPTNENDPYASVPVDVALSDVDASQYDGIFIVGGGGAMPFLDNQTTYKIMQKATELHKAIGAICISPRILAKAGLLINKRATGWDGDHKVATVLKQNGAHYTRNHVVTDGLIVTADGPAAAIDFGKAIVTVLKK